MNLGQAIKKLHTIDEAEANEPVLAHLTPELVQVWGEICEEKESQLRMRDKLEKATERTNRKAADFWDECKDLNERTERNDLNENSCGLGLRSIKENDGTTKIVIVSLPMGAENEQECQRLYVRSWRSCAGRLAVMGRQSLARLILVDYGRGMNGEIFNSLACCPAYWWGGKQRGE